jgi:hypothetical protein
MLGDDCALIGWYIRNNHDILSQWNERNNSNGTLFHWALTRSLCMKSPDLVGLLASVLQELAQSLLALLTACHEHLQ